MRKYVDGGTRFVLKLKKFCFWHRFVDCIPCHQLICPFETLKTYFQTGQSTFQERERAAFLSFLLLNIEIVNEYLPSVDRRTWRWMMWLAVLFRPVTELTAIQRYCPESDRLALCISMLPSAKAWNLPAKTSQTYHWANSYTNNTGVIISNYIPLYCFFYKTVPNIMHIFYDNEQQWLS